MANYSYSFLSFFRTVKIYSQKHNIVKANEANLDLLIAKTNFMMISDNVVLIKN